MPRQNLNTPTTVSTQTVRECPDIASSTPDYAKRFAGPVGDYFLEVQWQAVNRLLATDHPCRILDVGGGHGQLAQPLVQQGHEVTVFGSAASCRRRLDQLVGADRYGFVEGNLMSLPWSSGSFDVVLAFRMIPHLTDWPRFLSELCRVSADMIIIDYPDIRSVNILSSQTFALKKKIENNTRSFRCFRRRQITAELTRHGFCDVVVYPQFLFPMVLHRWLGLPRVSRLAEAMARVLGLTQVWGSPVILKAVRKTNTDRRPRSNSLS